MAPYDPPDTHYAHLDVSMYEENMILCMIGKGGKGFYKITSWLDLDYVWYDSKEKRIELWGDYVSLQNGEQCKLKMALDNFKKKYKPIKKDE